MPLIAFMPVLVGCDMLGIEITTIKGHWQSNKYENGEYTILELGDGTFDIMQMVTDSTYSERTNGTWINKGDTITLFANRQKPVFFIVKQLSMDKMTIQQGLGKKCFIMSRIYKDPSNKFYEVLSLKKGLWYWVYMAMLIIQLLLGLLSIFYWLIELVKLVKKWILKILRR